MGPIGVFDSGYGGLTVLNSIRQLMPEYDYVYLGDNARAPYGTRDFAVVHEYTLQAVKKLFEMDCPLIILACNTASAKALRTIQQHYLAQVYPNRRVLGVIRPTAEIVGSQTKTGHIGILATPGTIKSESYSIEITKLYPKCTVTGVACPSWVPLVENQQHESQEAFKEVRQQIELLLERDRQIDCIILGCTHYPLLMKAIEQACPPNIRIISQGEYVAKSLKDYLARHTDIESSLTRGSACRFFTTGDSAQFISGASIFMAPNDVINAKNITL